MTTDTRDDTPKAKPGKSVLHRLRDGFGWSALGALAWRALTAVSSVLVARILGPAGFGELGIVRSTANLFTVYAGFRLGTTANKHLAEFRESDPDRAGRILRMSLFMSAVFCAATAAVLIFGGGYIAANALNNPDLDLALRIAGVFLFFQAYSTVRETVLIGTENFKAFARVNVAKGVLSAGLILPGAWFWGATGAIGGLALAAFLSYLVLQYYVRQALRDFDINENVPFRVWKVELPLLWTFALPGLITGAIGAMVLWYGRVALTGAEEGYVQLGLFEAANQWRTMILFLPATLSRVAMPVLAETYGRDRDGDFRNAVALQFRANLLITLPLTVVVIAFADWLMWIFGEQYAQSGPILPLLMISVFLFALNQSLRKVQDGSGKRWQNMGIQILWAVAFLVPLWWAGSGLDAVGLAWCFLAAEVVMFVAQILYIEIRLARGTVVKVARDVLISVLAISLALLPQFLTFGDGALAVIILLAAFGCSVLPAAILVGRDLRAARRTGHKAPPHATSTSGDPT